MWDAKWGKGEWEVSKEMQKTTKTACTSVLQEFERKWCLGIVRKETGSPSQNGEWQEPRWEGKGVKGLKNSGPSLTPYPRVFKVHLLLTQWLLKLSLFLLLTQPVPFSRQTWVIGHVLRLPPQLSSPFYMLIVLVFQELSFLPTNCPNDDKHSESFHFLQVYSTVRNLRKAILWHHSCMIASHASASIYPFVSYTSPPSDL